MWSKYDEEEEELTWYRIWARYKNGDEDYVDDAEGEDERDYLLREYKASFGPGWTFRVEKLPGEPD